VGSKRLVGLLFGFLGNEVVQFPEVSEERSTSIFMVRIGFTCILNWLEKGKLAVILQTNCKTHVQIRRQLTTKPINTLKPEVMCSLYLALKKSVSTKKATWSTQLRKLNQYMLSFLTFKQMVHYTSQLRGSNESKVGPRKGVTA